MRSEQILQSTLKIFVFIVTMALFTSQAFCADPNGTKAAVKPQAKKPPQIKTAPEKTKPSISPSGFRPDMPLRDAIDILRNSTKPPLNIVVLWKDLEDNADITRDTPIGIDSLSGVPLKTHLSILLASLSSGSQTKLGYIVDGGVIIIATKDSLPKKIVARSYDIADVVAPPSTGGLMGGIGMGMGMNGMPYGTMMPYGMNNSLSGLNQYINPNYPNQMYPNQLYQNQVYPNQGYPYQNYPNQGYPNQGYPYQGLIPNNNLNSPRGSSMAPRL